MNNYINECVLLSSILIMAFCLKKFDHLFKGIESEEELEEKLDEEANNKVIVNGIVFIISLGLACLSFYNLM